MLEPMFRVAVDAIRHRRAMRRARSASRTAVDRGGRNWTREDLYERVRTR
jgi:hypothetical protein